MALWLLDWMVFGLLCWYLTMAQMFVDNGMDQTIIYRPLAFEEKQEMQQELLHLLGLDHRPKPKDHAIQRSAPQYLIDLYRTLVNTNTIYHETNVTVSRNNLAINESDVIMSFVNRIDHHAHHFRHDRDRRFWFDVSDVSPEEEIMGAELRLYRDLNNSHLSSNSSYILSLYCLTENGMGEDGLQLIDIVILRSDQEGWIVFNVTDSIITWIAFPQKNLGLYLQIRTKGMSQNIDPSELGIVGRKGDSKQQPFMVAFLQTPREVHVRRTRSPRKRQTTYKNNPKEWTIKNKRGDTIDIYNRKNCQRLSFYVSFKQLNWEDWIIAPDGYAAFYCDGECSFPLSAHMNATNHAIVQTLVHLMDPSVVPKPFCAPTRLSPVQVLYFDDSSNVVLKKYRNMVVESCGCH